MRGSAAQVVPRRHRFTVEDYHRMGETGILNEDARVELIEGEIVQMPPMGSQHSGKVGRLNGFFMKRLGDRVIVWPQLPITLSEHSEPQPDLALLHPRDDFYESGHPTPDCVYLLIEVTQSSLAFDMGAKARLYAQAGIPEYWVVKVASHCIIVHRDPRPAGLALARSAGQRQVKRTAGTALASAKYATVKTFAAGDFLAPLAFPDCRVRVGDLLP